MKVKMNNEKPAANMVLNSNELLGTSPELTWTIYVVIVSMGTSGFNVKRGCCPAAMATIIVSPIARERAKITDEIIPDDAAGTSTLNEV